MIGAGTSGQRLSPRSCPRDFMLSPLTFLASRAQVPLLVGAAAKPSSDSAVSENGCLWERWNILRTQKKILKSLKLEERRIPKPFSENKSVQKFTKREIYFQGFRKHCMLGARSIPQSMFPTTFIHNEATCDSERYLRNLPLGAFLYYI